MNLIASVSIPNLAIAVARRSDPALHDAPLILYTATRGRTIVAAASDDTGIAAGTPLVRQSCAARTPCIARQIPSAISRSARA